MIQSCVDLVRVVEPFPIIQEALAAEILSKDLELCDIKQRLAIVIDEKENEIKQLTSRLHVRLLILSYRMLGNFRGANFCEYHSFQASVYIINAVYSLLYNTVTSSCLALFTAP